MQNSEFGMNTERKQHRLRAADTEEAKAEAWAVQRDDGRKAGVDPEDC